MYDTANPNEPAKGAPIKTHRWEFVGIFYGIGLLLVAAGVAQTLYSANKEVKKRNK